jgi:membrane-associated phospholipid phosphatase
MMVSIFGVLSAVTVIGCILTDTRAKDSSNFVALATVVAATTVLPSYWHDKQRASLRDASSIIPWLLIIVTLFPFPFLVAARVGIPLRDNLLASFDSALGVNVSSIQLWADHHWMGKILNWSYDQLMAMLYVASLLPSLTGKAKAAKEFVLANMIAVVIGLPLFAMLPAIGPWIYYHTTATPMQSICEEYVRVIRQHGTLVFSTQGLAIVCFPSFHVIWAVLCARSLSVYRIARLPVMLLSTMVVVSTMTTGMHYLVDVLGGLVVATVAILVASRLLRAAYCKAKC